MLTHEATCFEQLAGWRRAFRTGVEAFDRAWEVLILTHNDVDGLAAGAIFKRVFDRARRPAAVRILGRGENPWTPEVKQELEARRCGGLVVTDLGTRSGIIKEGTATIIVDHHVPMGTPAEGVVISGYGFQPTPTSGLLAWWCGQELAAVDDLLWIAALSIIGDMGEQSGFEELKIARARFGITPLREAVSLLNAARRAESGNAQPAFDLLLKAENPKEITSGKYRETKQLLAAKEQVATALQQARRLPPKIKGDVALIMLDSRCQIHPLIAQQWKARLHKNIVLAANKGYRPGWVHFSVRSATGVNLIQFLKEKAPADVDENYGSGHVQATGGALPYAAWNEFVSGLGFGPEMQVTP